MNEAEPFCPYPCRFAYVPPKSNKVFYFKLDWAIYYGHPLYESIRRHVQKYFLSLYSLHVVPLKNRPDLRCPLVSPSTIAGQV